MTIRSASATPSISTTARKTLPAGTGSAAAVAAAIDESGPSRTGAATAPIKRRSPSSAAEDADAGTVMIPLQQQQEETAPPAAKPMSALVAAALALPGLAAGFAVTMATPAQAETP